MKPEALLPSFSVLIANFNYGHLVARAVDSVLAQDYPAALREVIVVDDGSTDDSLQRLQAYAGRADVRVVGQPNRGHTAAFAAGLEHARGELVCLLDADDRCLPNKLQRLAACLAALPEPLDQLFLCHDLEVLNGVDGPPVGRNWFDVIGLPRGLSPMRMAGARHFFPFSVTSGMVFGRALLQRVMAEVPVWEWRMGADAILGHTAFMLTGEVRQLREVLGSYVVHGDNDSLLIVDGLLQSKSVGQARWPKTLRFLELLLDSLALDERQHRERSAYLGRLEQQVRVAPAGRQHRPPLLSFIVDAREGQDLPARMQATAAAIAGQVHRPCELVWVCTEGAVLDLPAEPAEPDVRRVSVPQGATHYQALRAGLNAALGGFVCFVDAGDRPDRRCAERHINAHGDGALPALSVSDLRLLDAHGVLIQSGVQTRGAWAGQANFVPAFARLLQDWPLAPLPAVVMRRTPLLAAFFRPATLPGHERHAAWLLCQFMLQAGGAVRLTENLVDLPLPPSATPHGAWLAQFIDRQGPLPTPDLPGAAELLFASYLQAAPAERGCFPDGWEAEFLGWLVRSGGDTVPARVRRQLQRLGDAATTEHFHRLLGHPAPPALMAPAAVVAVDAVDAELPGPPAAARRRVALLTTVDFWRQGAGHRARIRQLAQCVSRHTALTVVIPTPLSAPDRALIAAALPAADIESLELPLQGSGRDALIALRRCFLARRTQACIFEYLALGWMRPAVLPGMLSLVDTHDVVSQRDAELHAMGAVLDRRVMSAEEEAAQLRAFDHVIAICRPDAEVFRQWVGHERVLLAQHAHPLRLQAIRPQLRRLLFVGNFYEPNVDGLRWFIDQVWPRLAGSGLVLDIVGAVGPAMGLADGDGLCVHGQIDNLATAYAAADLSINPVRHGSGLKIKTVEALAHGLPLVATSHATRGLEHGAGVAFLVADDAEAFARAISALAAEPPARQRLAAGAAAFAAAEFSDKACYGPLLAALGAAAA